MNVSYFATAMRDLPRGGVEVIRVATLSSFPWHLLTMKTPEPNSAFEADGFAAA